MTELESVVADAKRMAVEAGENSPLGYTLAVLVDALTESEKRLDGYSAMCAEQEARADRAESRAAALEAERRADDEWMGAAMKAIEGLKAGAASFTGHPVVDCVAELRALVAALAARDAESERLKGALRDAESVLDSLSRFPAEHAKWRRGERHLCLSCGKAEPFNGCAALCPECLQPRGSVEATNGSGTPKPSPAPAAPSSTP
jgi:hypothetical protein